MQQLLIIISFLAAMELPWALAGFLKPALWIGGIAGLVIALLFEADSRGPKRKARLGKCQLCGYDLRGNVSGICPECGTQIQKDRALRRSPILRTLPLGSEAGIWLRRRLLYRNLLVAFCALVAFYFTPNRIIFGQFTALSPKDFVDEVNSDFAPVVRAVYAYDHDTGHLPSFDLHELIPNYLPSQPKGRPELWKNELSFYARFPNRVTYDLSTSQDVWEVHGYVSGRIRAAPIIHTALVSSQPTTKP